MKSATTSIHEKGKENPSKSSKEGGYRYGTSREALDNKYAAIRDQSRQASRSNPAENNITSAKVSLLDSGKSQPGDSIGEPSSGLASKWLSMKTGFRSFRANIGAKRFLPLRQSQEDDILPHSSSHESLDEIFQRLKRPSGVAHGNDSDEDEDVSDISISEPRR